MTVIRVSNDLTMDLVPEKQPTAIMLESEQEASWVVIDQTELPALLARLERVAAEMGIPTAQAEMAELLREMIDVFDGYELTAALPLHLRERAEQALASVKQ